MFGLTRLDTALAIAFAALSAVASALAVSPLFGLQTALLAIPLALIFATDLRFHRIPDVLSLPLIPLGLAVTLTATPELFLDHAAAAALGGGVFLAVRMAYRHWRGFDGLGLGDVKLMAAAGAWTGISALAPIVVIACAVLLAALLLRGGAGRLERLTRVPFGTGLAIGTLAAWLFVAAL